MQDGVYNALFGAMTQEHRLNQISNNMANLNTVGYKQDKMAFEDVLTHYAHDFLDPNFGLSGGVTWPEGNQMTQPRIGVSEIAFEQGPVKQTGNQLDLALDGEGFFKIQTPDGDFYSRNGQFKINAQNQLVNSQGQPLLGQGGPIQLPEQGEVEVDGAGRVFVNQEEVGQIDVVTISDLSQLEKRGQTLLQLKEDSQAQEVVAPEETQVLQGALEESNVQVVEEMVRMIQTMRTFEACQKAMKNSNEQDLNLINRVGNPS